MDNPTMTTVCYLEKDGCYLMLHRIKKEYDLNKDKWIGIGGHFKTGECPEECAIREVREETGLLLTHYRLRGIITFLSDNWPQGEYMFLFTADAWTGDMIDCDEGDLAWIEKDKLAALPLWEGDRIFLRLLDMQEPFFSLKLCYQGDTLHKAFLNGKDIEI